MSVSWMNVRLILAVVKQSHVQTLVTALNSEMLDVLKSKNSERRLVVCSLAVRTTLFNFNFFVGFETYKFRIGSISKLFFRRFDINCLVIGKNINSQECQAGLDQSQRSYCPIGADNSWFSFCNDENKCECLAMMKSYPTTVEAYTVLLADGTGPGSSVTFNQICELKIPCQEGFFS